MQTFATCPVDGVRKALLGGDLKGGLIALVASLLVGWHKGKARKARQDLLKHQAVSAILNVLRSLSERWVQKERML